MNDNRVYMARFKPEMVIGDDPDPQCNCGWVIPEGETVALYPVPEYDDENLRDIVCLTCHFWFVHDVQSELGA